MCGIAGIWNKASTSFGVSELMRLNEVQKHRGPDDEGYLLYSEGASKAYSGSDSPTEIDLPKLSEAAGNFQVSLAHRRLSIIDLSAAAHQPMSEEKCHLVFNGAIYNFRELRSELSAKGHVFKGSGDTEVLLKAYLEWGTNCLDRLDGMFAFVLFDEREKKLFGARDRTGVKPLYFVNDSKVFSFASEARALKVIQKASRVNHFGVIDFLLTGNQEGTESSMFEGVFELKPSQAFEFSGALRIWNYYDGKQEQKEVSMQSAVLEVRRLLEEGIQAHCIADVPVASCLSGGIDSSAIMGIAAANSRHSSLAAFSAVFPGKTIDESDYAKAVAEKWQVKWHRVEPNLEGFQDNIRLLHEIHDFPLISSSTYAQFELMRAAKQAGIKVLLDGQGADELFGGYPQYRFAYLNELKRKHPLQAVSYLAKQDFSIKSWLKNNAKQRIIARPERFKALLIKLYPELNFIEPDLLHGYLSAKTDSDNEAYFLSANDYLAEDYFGEHLKNLLRYEDRNSMHFSIESRTPFADDRALMEYVFSLPASMKLQDSPSKYLLREAVKPYLPTKVLARKDKKGFVSPHNSWVNASRDLFSELFNGKSQVFRSNIEGEDIRKLCYSSTDNEDYRRFRFLSTALWEDTHFK